VWGKYVFSIKYKALRRLARTYRRKVIIHDELRSLDLGLEEVKLVKGNDPDLPSWLIDILEPEGIIGATPITIDEIARYLYQEKQNSSIPASLVQISNDFYFRANHLLRELSKAGNNITQLESLKKASQMLDELKRTRGRKIVQLASLNVSDQSLINKMTTEEYLVYRELRNIINTFVGDISGNS
jgi:DNA replication factor GINS